MEKLYIHEIMLEQYIRRLYAVSKQINLLYFKEHTLNIEKLKSDIQMIKGLVESIETEIDNL